MCSVCTAKRRENQTILEDIEKFEKACKRFGLRVVGTRKTRRVGVSVKPIQITVSEDFDLTEEEENGYSFELCR